MKGKKVCCRDTNSYTRGSGATRHFNGRSWGEGGSLHLKGKSCRRFHRRDGLPGGEKKGQFFLINGKRLCTIKKTRS